MARRRILFVSEFVTLAQVVRLVELAACLDRTRYEVHFACAEFPEFIFGPHDFIQWPLWTVDARRALARVETGRRLYDRPALERCLAADLRVIEQVEPDLIVGDLRWSLAVSAPLAGVPHVALANAYWSPHAVRAGFPVPDHPIVRVLGLPVAERYFPRAMPWVFAHFAAPLNAMRRKHGLAEIGSLPEIVTYGDHTLFADVPELVPMATLPPGQCYLGPVVWSAPGSVPESWGRDERRAAVYVTLGSSGKASCLPLVLQALEHRPVDVLVATADRAALGAGRASVHAAPFVPGSEAARRARVVVCNGGSGTSYQGLLEGTPVVGLPHNLDQYLSMDAVESFGAGIGVRAGSATVTAIRAALDRVLGDPSFDEGAGRARAALRAMPARQRFRAFVDRAVGAVQARSGPGIDQVAP